MSVYVCDCVVTAGCLQGDGKGLPSSERLRPSAFTRAKCHPLPATTRGIHGHGLSGKQLDNVFTKAYLQVHWQRNGSRRCGIYMGFPSGTSGKESTSQCRRLRDEGSIPGVHNGILLSYYKKNKIIPFAATWMDPEIIILSEVSQTQKDQFHMISLICGI